MIEKRFTFHHDVDGIDYIKDKSNGFCLICDELMCSLLNELHEENEVCKEAYNEIKSDAIHLKEENEQLKKELFEARKDYILETYADNPIRRDEKLKELKKELEE